LSEKENLKDAYKKFAEGLQEIEEEDKKAKKEIIKKGVLELEQKYKEEIKGTHAVDARLVKLRQEAGMPELIGVGDKVDKKRFKDKEKFEHFLAKEILEVGIEESRNYGGVMLFKDFCKIFAEKRPNWVAPPKEIKKALEYLAAAGLIPKMFKMKNKAILITFKPAELSRDLLTILNLVPPSGFLTVEELSKILGWQKERVELSFRSLVEQEIAYYDKQAQGYHFPVMKH